jgi:hypothetical protein
LRGRGGIAGAGLLAAALLILLVLPASASAGARCGVKDGVLKVFPPSGLGNFAEIVRGKTHKRVVVKDDKGIVKCNGETARLPTLDEIRAVGRKKTRSITALNMANGGFPRTEINVLAGSKFDIFFVLGRSKRTPGGANDQIGLAGGRPDGSVTIDPGTDQTFARLAGVQRAVLVGARGNDFLSASQWEAQLFLFGNAGGDNLYAGKKAASIFGDQGGDRVHGGRGRDLIVGGDGHDRFGDVDGSDFFKTRDRTKEAIDCGPGRRDVVKRDGRDRLLGNCEFVTVNRAATPPPAPPEFRFAWAGRELFGNR